MKVEGPVVTEGLSDELNVGNGFLSEIGESVPCAIIYHKKTMKLKVGSEEIELIRTLNDRELAKNTPTGKVVKGEDKHEPKQSTNSTGGDNRQTTQSPRTQSQTEVTQVE